MRVGRREFVWVFPQLSLLDQTSSESCMRVDESLSSFFDFLVFASCFHASFSSFFDACQTADSPSHYSNCHLSMIRNNISFFFFFFFWVYNDLEIACFSTQLSTTLVQLSWPVKRAKIWTSSKLMRAHESSWELMRVGGETRARVATLIHSHWSSFDQGL